MNYLESIIERDPQVCFTQINLDEIVILNPVDENFYHLNESAVDLWLALDTPKCVLELAGILSEKYDGHPDEYQNDVVEWIEDTIEKGLLITLDKIDVKTTTQG